MSNIEVEVVDVAEGTAEEFFEAAAEAYAETVAEAEVAAELVLIHQLALVLNLLQQV